MVAAVTSTGARVFASPLARKIAREKGFDIAAITGTGPHGRVVLADVDEFVPAAAVAAAPAATALTGSEDFTDMKPTTIRKIIAARLLESKLTIPHYYLSIDVEMDTLMQTRAQLNAMGGDTYKLSVNDFVVKASALALRDVPDLNSSWMGDFVRQYHNVDINVAMAAESGLVTPLVQGVDKMGLSDISTSVKAMAGKAGEGKLTPMDMASGGFTISNLGMFGIKNFCAVINPPQAAILAVGTSVKNVVPGPDGEMKVVSVMNVTLSCDHRVVDGATGAQWLSAFKGYIENPMKMLV